MGAGKTLLASIVAYKYRQKYKDNTIYANYHLNLDNFVYTPYFFLPISQLENAMIIFDDISNLNLIKNLMKLIANVSRKRKLYLILTMQYYTMATRELRAISNA